MLQLLAERHVNGAIDPYQDTGLALATMSGRSTADSAARWARAPDPH